MLCFTPRFDAQFGDKMLDLKFNPNFLLHQSQTKLVVAVLVLVYDGSGAFILGTMLIACVARPSGRF